MFLNFWKEWNLKILEYARSIAFFTFLFGTTYGIFEVVLNLQATSLEKKFERPIMSGIHAFWSIGLLSGSFLTSIFLVYELSFFIN